MTPRWMAMTALAITGLALVASASAQPASIQSETLPPLQQQWQQDGTQPVQQPPPPSLSQPAVPLNTQAPAQPFQQTPQSQLQPPPGQLPEAPAPGQPQAPQDQAAQPQAPTAPVTFDRPNIWLPATTVKLEALDKVDAQSTALTIKVGQSATFGSLTITAKACVTRPADQPADAAAYLDVTDSHPDLPPFNGWILEDEPSVSMLQHPIYDLRVTGCT